MMSGHFGAMRDADDGRFGQTFVQQRVELGLAGCVEVRGRFVQEQPFRSVRAMPARRRRAAVRHRRAAGSIAPFRRGVPRDATSPTSARTARSCGIREGLRRGRIGDRFPQRADREVRPLRKEQRRRTRAVCGCGRARRARCRRARERACSCRNRRVRATRTRSPGSRVADAPASSTCPLGSARSRPSMCSEPLPGAVDRDARIGARLGLGCADRIVEAREPVDGRLPAGELRVDVDEPGQRILHVAERHAVCVRSPSWSLAGEVARRGDDVRKDDRGLAVAVGEGVERASDAS